MLKHIGFAAAVALLAAGAAGASVQARDKVGWLGAGDWQLRDEGGRASFARAPYKPGARVRHTSWSVSNPTVKSSRGSLLCYDASGRDPEARLLKRAGGGDSARWSFEAVSRIHPKLTDGEERVKEGPAGMTFRLRAAEGPYKGWYLAAKGGEGGKRRLTLVRARKDATVFKYIGEYFYVRP